MNYLMVKKYLKRLKKLPPIFQFKFIEIIDNIENWNFDDLDIIELAWKKWYFRCRIWKFRIIFYKDINWEYIIDDIWSRWDIYK